MDLGKVFVHNMKNYQKLTGFSQKKLAELCNASHSYIRQIECGAKCPSFGFIEKLASALNIPPSHLFIDGEDEKAYKLAKTEKIEAELMEKLAKNVHSAFARL
jgi:transcriptional regulator with XRE-family HTH domain